MMIELCYLLSPTSTHNSSTVLQTYAIQYTNTNSLPVGCHAMQLVTCSSTLYAAVSEGSTTKVGLVTADKTGLTR
jgi:hypothetical protein